MAEVGGAALGAIFGELLKSVLKMKNNAILFKSTLANLESILQALDPLIKDITKQNNDLGHPKEELESLIRKMKDGSKLIFKCSKIHKLNYLAKLRYQKKLKALLDSLHMFFSIEMLAQSARDQKETLLIAKRILNKLSFHKIEDTKGLDEADSMEMQLAEK